MKTYPMTNDADLTVSQVGPTSWTATLGGRTVDIHATAEDTANDVAWTATFSFEDEFPSECLMLRTRLEVAPEAAAVDGGKRR